jgi:hypothetical protein
MAERTTTTFDAAAYTQQGTARDRVALPPAMFDGTVNTAVMHQAVKAYLANQRGRSDVVAGMTLAWLVTPLTTKEVPQT